MTIESFSQNNIEPQEEKAKEPWEFSYNEFIAEYENVMQSVSEKEKNGRLDPDNQPYEVISPAEQQLLERDWKEFSRQRGFSENDIKEYERWLILSGQRDNLEGAINDPWRRSRFDHAKSIYIKHIENAIATGKEVSSGILEELKSLKAISKNNRTNKTIVSPEPQISSESKEDVW